MKAMYKVYEKQTYIFRLIKYRHLIIIYHGIINLTTKNKTGTTKSLMRGIKRYIC